MFFAPIRTLPKDWMDQLQSISIEDKFSNPVERRIARVMKYHIEYEGERAIVSRFAQEFLECIFGSCESFLPGLEELPMELVDEVAKELETNKSKGIQRQRKLNSSMIELTSYSKLNEAYGYKIKQYEREEGSCDLQVSDGDNIHNIEVKFKMDEKSPDRLVEYMMYGMSMLPENTWMRNNKYWITLYERNINYASLGLIEEDLFGYFSEAHEEYKTDNLRIFQERGSQIESDFVTISCGSHSIKVVCPKLKDLEKIIDKILVTGADGSKPIDKMFDKHSKIDNFSGLLAWEIPWSWSKEDSCGVSTNIRRAIRNRIEARHGGLPFDLYIWLKSFEFDEMILLKKFGHPLINEYQK